MGWNHRHHAGSLLRTIGTAAVLLAEKIDPQPLEQTSFTIYGDGHYTNTSGTLAKITWHPTG
jgi:hypothetical protein